MFDSEKNLKTPATTEEIFAALSAIVVEALRVDPAAVTREARLFDDLGAESLDILDIRFRMEQVFGFKIDEDDLVRSLKGADRREIQSLLSVGHLAEYASRRLAERASPA